MEKNQLDITVSQMLNSSYNIAIVPSVVAGVDAFAAALALYVLLKREGKTVSLIYQSEAPEILKEMINPDDKISDPSERELVVSIDYTDTKATKVNYHTAGDVLFLKIFPVSKDFNLSNVKAGIRGLDYDLIITLGAQTLEDFGVTYDHLREEFFKANTINIDNTDRNQRYGKVNIVDSGKDSLSLLTMNSIGKWGYEIDTRLAKILMKGISHRNPN